MEYERAIMDPRFNELEFTATDFSSNRPKSKNKTLKDKVGNPAWRTDLYFPQTIILSLEKMSNVTYFYLESFDKGCNLDISIAEHETGPYVQVVHKKFFARSELRRIKLGSLPCKFLKIVVHKGGYISPEQIHLVGFHAEDAGEIFGDNLFELLVANSQRLIYS